MKNVDSGADGVSLTFQLCDFRQVHFSESWFLQWENEGDNMIHHRGGPADWSL